MNMIPVSSSNIDSVGYNPTLKELTIVFNSGGVYTYIGVPQHIYDGLMSASSKGEYHHDNIKQFTFRHGY